MVEAMRKSVSGMLEGIERYNPENLTTLERYVDIQCTENIYDIEANLAVLKLYQLNENLRNNDIVVKILLKSLTNFPHTDFVLCKCLLSTEVMMNPVIVQIMHMSNLLECCDFQMFWKEVTTVHAMCAKITGFHDSIRKFVCHVVGITFQTIEPAILSELLGKVDDLTLKHWVQKYGWREEKNGLIFIANQDENIKTKNITEKIDFDNIAAIMAACR